VVRVVLQADNEEGSDGEYTVNDELMDCARYGEIDDVRRLLTSEPGVDVNFVDDSGNTATHNGLCVLKRCKVRCSLLLRCVRRCRACVCDEVGYSWAQLPRMVTTRLCGCCSKAAPD
jgi:hypothetical protein